MKQCISYSRRQWLRREVFKSFLSEYGKHAKTAELFRQIKMSLNEIYRKVRHRCTVFCNIKCLECSETRKCFTAVSFQLVFVHVITNIKEGKGGLEINGTHQLPVYADNLSGNTIKEHRLYSAPAVGLVLGTNVKTLQVMFILDIRMRDEW
jgi:hypothetical protein